MSPHFRITLAALAVLTGLLALATCASAAEVEAFATYDHTSDIARGCPRRCAQSEPVQEFLGGGVTITAGKRRAWEVDVAHGAKWINGGKYEGGSKVAARFYPGRLRR